MAISLILTLKLTLTLILTLFSCFMLFYSGQSWHFSKVDMLQPTWHNYILWLSQWPLHTHCNHLWSSASAFCNYRLSAGSICEDQGLWAKFCRQRADYPKQSTALYRLDLSQNDFKWRSCSRSSSTAEMYWMTLEPFINAQTYLFTVQCVWNINNDNYSVRSPGSEIKK